MTSFNEKRGIKIEVADTLGFCMIVSAIQSNYIPWKGYFDLIQGSNVFVFYDEVQYTKNDWRNRNLIYSSNGLQWLTIPIPQASVKLKISEVVIKDSKWQKTHYTTLVQTYMSSPYFHQLEPLLKEIYLLQPWEKLSDLNRFVIRKICGLLKIRTQLLDSKSFDLPEGRIERLLALLIQLKTKTYISGPSGVDYLSQYEELFLKNGIQIQYKEYPNYPAYPQQCGLFQNQVSILDMIANIELSQIPDYIWNSSSLERIAERVG